MGKRTKEDFAKMSFNELKDARTVLTPVVNGYSLRVEEGQALKAEEREIFNTAVTELEFINEVINASDGGMVERAHIATMPSNVANVANVFHNLTGNVNVKPNHENDPRFGYATDDQGGGREFLYDVANAYKNDCNPEKINPRLRSIVCNAVGDDEYAFNASHDSDSNGYTIGIYSCTSRQEPCNQCYWWYTSLPNVRNQHSNKDQRRIRAD
jgi:hypothetical protein